MTNSIETAEILLSIKDGYAAKRPRISPEDIKLVEGSLQADANVTFNIPKFYETNEKKLALLKYNLAVLNSRLTDLTYVHARSYIEHKKDRDYYESIKEAEESLHEFDLDNPLRLKCLKDISLMHLTLSKKLDGLLVDKYGIHLPNSSLKLEYITREISYFDKPVQELKEKFYEFKLRTTLLSKLDGRKFEDEKNMLISMYTSISEGIKSIIRNIKVFA
jgi:hypothetical protein